jgi:hypothetical protein
MDDNTKNKLETFQESFKTLKPTVFCVNCGSTNLDQSGIFVLECYNCDAKGIWNGQAFGIARGGEMHDVLSAYTPPEDPFYFSGWRNQMCVSLEEFFLNVESTVIGEEDSITEKQLTELQEDWNKLQKRIELFLSRINVKEI